MTRHGFVVLLFAGFTACASAEDVGVHATPTASGTDTPPGGSTATPGDAGGVADAKSDGIDDGVDRTSVVFELYGADHWTFEGSNLDLPTAVFRLVNSSPQALQGIVEAQAWFQDGAPRTFDVAARPPNFRVEPGAMTKWTVQALKMSNGGAGLMVWNDYHAIRIPYTDATSYAPYATGAFHVVFRGTFVDGKRWEVSHAFPKAP